MAEQFDGSLILYFLRLGLNTVRLGAVALALLVITSPVWGTGVALAYIGVQAFGIRLN